MRRRLYAALVALVAPLSTFAYAAAASAAEPPRPTVTIYLPEAGGCHAPRGILVHRDRCGAILPFVDLSVPRDVARTITPRVLTFAPWWLHEEGLSDVHFRGLDLVAPSMEACFAHKGIVAFLYPTLDGVMLGGYGECLIASSHGSVTIRLDRETAAELRETARGPL